MITRLPTILLTTAMLGPGSPVPISKWQAAPPFPLPAGATDTILQDVAVPSAADVWFAGSWKDTRATLHPVAARWDGSSWTVLPTPAASDPYILTAVDATAPGDVWAAGSTAAPSASAPIVLHYQGAQATIVPTGPAPTDSALEDVDMHSDAEGWAVGTAGQSPLALHWSDGRWNRTAMPDLGTPARLDSVFDAGPGDAWAAGTEELADGTEAGLVLHWDATGWTTVGLPDSGLSSLDTIAGAGNEVWVAGTRCSVDETAPCTSLVMRRVDGAWLTVTPVAGTEVTDLVPFSATDVWTIGYVRSPIGIEAGHVEHWDGHAFTVDSGTAGTATGAGGNGQPASATALAAAAGDPVSHQLWAVGWPASLRRVPHVVYRN